MRLRETREIKLSKLNLPGGWEEKLDKAHVKDLVDQVKAGASLANIHVTTGRWLVQGVHRYAAYKAFGAKTARCDVMEYEDVLEEQLDRLAENLFRRQLSGEQRARDLAQIAEIVRKRLTQLHRHGDRDPRQRALTKDEINSEVAKLAKTSQASVERALKKVGASGPPGMRTDTPTTSPVPPGDTPATAPITPAFYTFGLPCPDDILAGALEAQAAIDAADKHLKAALATLGKLKRQGQDVRPDRGFSRSKAAEIYKLLHNLANQVRAARPAGLCHWCKGCGTINCATCLGTGVATVDGLKAANPEMKLEGEDQALVSVDGDLVLWSSQRGPVANGARVPEARR